jgi:ATP-dependent RNA helicase DDX19/DBP5
MCLQQYMHYVSVVKLERHDMPANCVCLQALYDEMKFERPSKIQASTLPMILRKSEQGVYRDLIAQAHNGSGKTTCFVLAMLSR